MNDPYDQTFAHGIGGAKDLPISPELAILGAVVALVVSFAVLALAWRTPRYAASGGTASGGTASGGTASGGTASGGTASGGGRPAPALLASVVDSPWAAGAARLVGVLALVYVVVVALFGKDLLTNPIFGIFYVWWWVGLIPLSLLLGPFWRTISPVRAINAGFARIAGSDPEVGVFTYPERLGYWPASLGLFAFVWMELVYPYATELSPVRLWCALYLGIMLVGGALFGNTFYARADPFEVFSTLVGKLSFWGRDARGSLVLRSPLANLATVEQRPGLVAVGAVLFGSTAFDSFKDSTRWLQLIQGHDFLTSSYVVTAGANMVAMILFILAVGGLFALGTMLTGVGPEQPRRRLPTAFAHSIVPIVVGYFVAHYLTYFLEVGQATLIQLSDPFGTGANLFGTGDWAVSYWFSSHQTLLANIKVGAVVVGHVVGVTAAHDRAISLLPDKHQVTGQLTLLAVMVTFTAGGLYLLFSA